MEKVMVKTVLGASAVALMAMAQATTITPNCQTQLSQIKAELQSQRVSPSISGKYEQAERLCAANQEMEAQQLAGEIRQEMAQQQPGAAQQPGAVALPQPAAKPSGAPATTTQ